MSDRTDVMEEFARQTTTLDAQSVVFALASLVEVLEEIRDRLPPPEGEGE